jgi:hypothetical protein
MRCGCKFAVSIGLLVVHKKQNKAMIILSYQLIKLVKSKEGGGVRTFSFSL